MIIAVSISPDGRFVSSINENNKVLIYELNTGRLAKEIQFNQKIYDAQFSK